MLLQVFDLTKAAVLRRLRLRLPNLPVERLQQVLTQAGGVALALWQHGPQAAWQAISAHAEGLRAQALDFVQQQVLGVAAKAVPLFLASLAVPGGAFLQVARGLYNGVMLFVEKGKQLAQVGQALFASASAIAAGQFVPAATAVENTLVKILPVALSFLARQLGLDGISGAIQTGLRKVQAPVEKAVNRVLDTVAQKAKAIWGTLKASAGKALNKGKEVATAVGTKVAGWLGLRKPFTNKAGEQHTLFVEGTENAPRFMIATTPMPIQVYLEQVEAQTKLLPRNDANRTSQLALVKSAKRLVEKLPLLTPQKGNAKAGETVAAQFEELSGLLMQLAGVSTVQDLPLPATAGWNAAASPQKMSQVLHVSSQTAYVGGSLGALSPPGWDLLQASGLTSNNRPWVRMHMISDKTGGPSKVENLLPAPSATNLGDVLEFEKVVKKLITTPQPVPALPDLPPAAFKRPSVVWVEAQTTGFHPAGVAPVTSRLLTLRRYDGATFATGIRLRAGLVYYNPSNTASPWVRDDKARVQSQVSIKLPDWQGVEKPSINLVGRDTIATLTGCSVPFARTIKDTQKDLPFGDLDDFTTRMENNNKRTPTFEENLQKVLRVMSDDDTKTALTFATS